MNEEHNPANKEPVEWFMEFVLEKRKVSDKFIINMNSNFSVLGVQESRRTCPQRSGI